MKTRLTRVKSIKSIKKEQLIQIYPFENPLMRFSKQEAKGGVIEYRFLLELIYAISTKSYSYLRNPDRKKARSRS